MTCFFPASASLVLTVEPSLEISIRVQLNTLVLTVEPSYKGMVRYLTIPLSLDRNCSIFWRIIFCKQNPGGHPVGLFVRPTAEPLLSCLPFLVIF
jgi:hypothetical protein